MNQQRLRLGVIGTGAIVSSRHLPTFYRIPNCEVAVVQNRRREQAELIAKRWGISRVVDTYQEVIDDADVDAVVIGTTPIMHREVAVNALRAGKHVFCQSRMARNVEEARAMLAAAEDNPNLVAMLCPTPRADTADAFVRNLLLKHGLGDIRFVRVRHLSDTYLDSTSALHWRQNRENCGNDVGTIGQYVEVLQRWFPPAVSVLAWGKAFTSIRLDPHTKTSTPVTRPDSLVVTGELGNGAHYLMEASAVAPFAELDSARRATWAAGQQIEIYGTKGALLYSPGANHLLLGQRPDDSELRVIALESALGPLDSAEAQFIAAVRTGKTPYPTFRDGLKYMLFIDAMQQSLETGSIVRITEG